MQDEMNKTVYSKNVIEFVALANEYCNFLEESRSHKRVVIKAYLLRIIPLIYFRAVILPEPEPAGEEENEKFVTEQDYINIENQLEEKFGEQDAFLEVFDPLMQESEHPVPQSLAENLTDIYQELKNFITLYRLMDIEKMNDAIWECKTNFKNEWGQKVVNTLRALHMISFGGDDEEEEDIPRDHDFDFDNIDTSNWLISRKIEDYNGDDQ